MNHRNHTPNRFSRKSMRTFGLLAMCFAVGLTVGSSSVGQGQGTKRRFTFADRKGDAWNWRVQANSGSVEIDKAFTAKGDVLVVSKQQNAELSCQSIEGDLISEPDTANASKTRTNFDNLNLKGGVRLVQKEPLATDPADASLVATTTLVSESATYKIEGDPRFARLDFPTKVTVTRDEGTRVPRSPFELIGSKGVVSIRRTPKKGESALIAADLTGGVSIEVKRLTIVQDKKEKKETEKREIFRAKARRLIYTVLPKPIGNAVNQIDLLDDLDLSSSTDGEDGPEISGASKATLLLNEKNEIVSIKLFSEGENSVTTKIRPKTKKPGERQAR